jgi:hypothetical protein
MGVAPRWHPPRRWREAIARFTRGKLPIGIHEVNSISKPGKIITSLEPSQSWSLPWNRILYTLVGYK